MLFLKFQTSKTNRTEERTPYVEASENETKMSQPVYPASEINNSRLQIAIIVSLQKSTAIVQLRYMNYYYGSCGKKMAASRILRLCDKCENRFC